MPLKLLNFSFLAQLYQQSVMHKNTLKYWILMYLLAKFGNSKIYNDLHLSTFFLVNSKRSFSFSCALKHHLCIPLFLLLLMLQTSVFLKNSVQPTQICHQQYYLLDISLPGKNSFSILNFLWKAFSNNWFKLFKSGPSKICGRQRLKILN